MSAERRASVLLVDDQPENLLALEAVLRPLGLRTVRATSASAAVRKMIGVARLRGRVLIICAASRPSIPGICTSSRITAKSSESSLRSASSPDPARTVRSPSGLSTASSASRFSCWSSTSSTLAVRRGLTPPSDRRW